MDKTTKYNVNSSRVNWGGLDRDVASALGTLRLAWEASERALPADLHAEVVSSIYGPTLRLLGEFCACVETFIEMESDAKNQERGSDGDAAAR